jgi:hypothetical protein
MADDEQLVQCPYCDDNSGRCDSRYPKLDGDEERYFSLTLRRDFIKITVYIYNFCVDIILLI